MKKKYLNLFILTFLFTFSINIITFAETNCIGEPSISVLESLNITSPRADNIDWIYNIIDGKVYRRLYNYTTKQWIGEWELVS